MNRRAFLAATGAGLSATVAGCFGTGLAKEDYDVAMYSNRFEPKRIEISVGDTVVWGNTGSRPHTVTAYDDGIPSDGSYFASGGFDSEQAARDGWYNGNGGVTPGDTYSTTFETAGKFTYFCIPHERGGMTGTVIVSD